MKKHSPINAMLCVSLTLTKLHTGRLELESNSAPLHCEVNALTPQPPGRPYYVEGWQIYREGFLML